MKRRNFGSRSNSDGRDDADAAVRCRAGFEADWPISKSASLPAVAACVQRRKLAAARAQCDHRRFEFEEISDV